MKIKLDKGAYRPQYAHEKDGGMDLFARDSKLIPARSSEIFDTGVHIELPPSTVGFLKSRSGLNIKHGLSGEGVIDAGYTGSIIVKLYNHSDTEYMVTAGDRIIQLVILPVIRPSLEIVDKLYETERGDNGFGSTGK